MKKKIILGIFLVLILLSSGMLQAQSAGVKSSSALPEVKTYDQLRHAISEARAEARVRVEKAVEQERVREAWEIGRLIDAHVLQHKERAGYAEHVLTRLSGDLGMSERELYYALRFFRAYPILPLTAKLSWSHYRDLLAVKDPGEREAIAEQAVKNKWTQKEIRQAIRKVKAKDGEEDNFGIQELSLSVPGKPGTYKILLAKSGPYAGELAVDLGFSNYVSLSSVTASPGEFKDGEIVRFTSPIREEKKGDLKISPSPFLKEKGVETELYTYEAYVYKVLDGDTIEAVVDLGFGFVTTQTLRLRGIDAPEIVTADGMEAKKALEKMLEAKGAGTLSKNKMEPVPTTPILIKTIKSDKYDRYLADLFIHETYINQKLIDEGFAVLVED